MAIALNSNISNTPKNFNGYAPFFKKENRVIISREKHDFLESSELKADYMKNVERDGSVLIVIDDDPKNLRAIRKLNDDVVLLKDTALID